MTPAERDLLTRFLDDLAHARAEPKDPEAASLIARALNANPDGPYLLVQHTILADQALHAAQARIAELERQLQRPAEPAPSFLGGGASGPWGAGRGASTAVPATTPAPQASAYGQDGSGYGQTGYGSDQNAYGQGPARSGGVFSSGGGLGSFLRGAATTAAGVAGGEMLFQGLSGLFRPHYGFGGGFGGGGFGGAPEEVVVNNYYDDNNAGLGDQGGWDDGGSFDNGGGFDDGSGGGW
ncbi:MAG: DUF2076 domain-containing protein [Caulobacteraceae bacterium]|nr:DUF2076 domain-containing protein [Caulobacteraceae bacterium]